MTKSITTKIATLCGAALITIAMAAPASAVVIFSDDFNRANSSTVGMGWVEIEEDSPDVRVRNNELRIREDFGSATQFGLDTTGYQNVTLSFDFGGINTTFFETLDIYYNTGSGWNVLAFLPLGNTVGLDPITIDPNIAVFFADILTGHNSLDLRFEIFNFTSIDTARVDNVVLAGDLIPVPEPGSLALFGLGLAGRRKVA